MPQCLPLDPKQADFDHLVRTSTELQARHHFRTNPWCRGNDIGIADVMGALLQAGLENEAAVKESIKAVRQGKAFERTARWSLAMCGRLMPEDLLFSRHSWRPGDGAKPRRKALPACPRMAAS